MSLRRSVLEFPMQMSSAVIPPPGAAVHCLTLLSNGQMEAFLRSNPAHSRFSTRTTSSRCGSVCGSATSGAFQRRNARAASLPRRLRHAARACRRRLPPPWRAQQAVRSGCCATESSDRTYVRLALPLLLVHRFARRGGGGEGGTIITFLSSILGGARRPLSAPCHAQRAVRPSRCAEQLFVCSLACLIVWLPLFAG